MSDIVEIMRARKEPTIEVDMHYPQIVDSDTPDAECLEAADEIDRLRTALRDCLGWHDYSNDMHKPIEVRAAYMRARAALGEKA